MILTSACRLLALFLALFFSYSWDGNAYAYDCRTISLYTYIDGVIDQSYRSNIEVVGFSGGRTGTGWSYRVSNGSIIISNPSSTACSSIHPVVLHVKNPDGFTRNEIRLSSPVDTGWISAPEYYPVYLPSTSSTQFSVRYVTAPAVLVDYSRTFALSGILAALLFFVLLCR